jgi:hypothetical protein
MEFEEKVWYFNLLYIYTYYDNIYFGRFIKVKGAYLWLKNSN